MTLLRQGKAHALTIYLGEADQWQGKPLYVAIIHFLREHGCAGATATRAVAGYGAGSRLREDGGWHWSSDAPVVIQVIDQPERLRRLLPQLQEMLGGGLMTLHEVEVLKYTHARSRGLPTGLPVRQVMETVITTVRPETPVAEIIDLLLDAPFRALPVVDAQRRLQGIIGTADLIAAGVFPLRRGLMRAAFALDTQTAETVETPLAQARISAATAQEVMNRRVRTIGPETPIRNAAHLMLETGLRRLPVVAQDNTLLGIVTRADLLQVVVTSPLAGSPGIEGAPARSPSRPLPGLPIQQQSIAAYVQADVTTVREDAPLAEVIDALVLSPLKRVIVVDHDERVSGIISDVDVLVQMQEEHRPRLLQILGRWAGARLGRVPSGALRPAGGKAQKAVDVMNRAIITVGESASVQDTIERMMTSGRKILPVLDAQGRLKGVVGRSDLLRVLLES
jgi:CBS-domain-containing membrane protein